MAMAPHTPYLSQLIGVFHALKVSNKLNLGNLDAFALFVRLDF